MINRLSKSKVKPGKSSPPASQPSAVSRVTKQIEQLRSSDWATRSTAASELGKLGDHQATRALSTALRDPSAEAAREAAAALGALRDVSAVEALSAVVVNADGYFEGSVRVAAAEALGKLQDRRAVAVLITVVRDQAAEVSQAAIRALGLLKDERAIDLLVAVVRNNDNYYLPFVRQTAVEALTHLAVPSAKESLRRIAADSYLDASVRQAAGSALTVANSIN